MVERAVFPCGESDAISDALASYVMLTRTEPTSAHTIMVNFGLKMKVIGRGLDRNCSPPVSSILTGVGPVSSRSVTVPALGTEQVLTRWVVSFSLTASSRWWPEQALSFIWAIGFTKSALVEEVWLGYCQQAMPSQKRLQLIWMASGVCSGGCQP